MHSPSGIKTRFATDIRPFGGATSVHRTNVHKEPRPDWPISRSSHADFRRLPIRAHPCRGRAPRVLGPNLPRAPARTRARRRGGERRCLPRGGRAHGGSHARRSAAFDARPRRRAARHLRAAGTDALPHRLRLHDPHAGRARADALPPAARARCRSSWRLAMVLRDAAGVPARGAPSEPRRCWPWRDAWHSVGPVAVLAAAGPHRGRPERAGRSCSPPSSAQMVTDNGVATLRDWAGLGVSPKLQPALFGWVTLVDVLLSPVGLLAAMAAADRALRRAARAPARRPAARLRRSSAARACARRSS